MHIRRKQADAIRGFVLFPSKWVFKVNLPVPWDSFSWLPLTCAPFSQRRAVSGCSPAGSSPPERSSPSSREESRSPTEESCPWPWFQWEVLHLTERLLKVWMVGRSEEWSWSVSDVWFYSKIQPSASGLVELSPIPFFVLSPKICDSREPR